MTQTNNPAPPPAAAPESGNWFSGIADKLNPLNWFSDMGIGGFFKMLLLAIGAFAAARTETVQNWLGPLLDGDEPGSGKGKIQNVLNKIIGFFTGLMPDSLKEKVFGSTDITDKLLNLTDELIDEHMDDLSEPIRKVVKTHKKELGKLLVDTNGGKMTLGELRPALTSEKTLNALLIQKPEIAKALFTEAQKAGLGTDGEKYNSALMATLKTVINGPQLDVLLNDRNRKNTISVISSLLPAGLNEADLEAIIAKQMQGGKASQGLRNTLTAYLEKLSPSTPEEGKTAPVIDPAIQADFMKASLTQLVGAANMPALEKVKAEIGDAAFTTFITNIKPQDKYATRMYLLHPETLPTTMRFMDALNLAQVPAENQAALQELQDTLAKPSITQVSNIVSKGLDPKRVREILPETKQEKKDGKDVTVPIHYTPELFLTQMIHPTTRAYIAAAGEGNIAAIISAEMTDPSLQKFKPIMTEANLKAIQHFTDSCSRMVSGKKEDGSPSHFDQRKVALVTGALLDFAIDGNCASMEKNSALIARFFQYNQFSTAFHTLINELKLPQQQKLLDTISKHWGTRDQGLREVFADRESVRRVPKIICDKDDIGFWKGVGEAVFKNTKLAENEAALKEVKKVSDDLRNAQNTPSTPPVAHANGAYKGGTNRSKQI